MKPMRIEAGAGSLVALILGLALLTGCKTEYKDYDAFQVLPRQSYSQKPYVIEPPDSISIIAPNAPEINAETQQLRPDGYITLHLIGDVLAAGKTPTNLAMEIQEEISAFYEDVKVQVRMAGFNSKFYYMVGETRAGPVTYTGNDNVRLAVMKAGIPPTAWPERAVLIRPSEDPDLIRRMSIDLKHMLEQGDLSRNAVLEEGDMIVIPINPFAAFGRIVQNLISPVSPALQAVSTPARVAAAPGL